MKYVQAEGRFILKLERGEEVLKSLTDFAKQEKITFATVTGLGAVDQISCGYYALSERKYHFTQYEGSFEVLNATGNISLKEGMPFVHLHATFSDTANFTFGGHVESMRVGLVLEIVLDTAQIAIERMLDDETGLHLMEL